MSNNGIVNNNKRVEWSYQTNVYEVNVRQYTAEGSFNAFSKELPRLKEMGVDTLWFMPITPIAKERMKGTMGSYYACSDYTAINPEFGTLDDFKELVASAHKYGFKVIIDWVANHTGWDHVWTITHPEYFEKDANGNFKAASGMDDIIELDFNNPALVNAMIEAMRYWVLECDIDGFRCDLAAWVELHFWQTARPAVETIKPLFWLGEFDALDNADYMTVFDAAYAWQWMHKTEAFYKTERNVGSLVDMLARYNSTYPAGTTGLYFTSNHDENSWNGTEYEKYGDMALTLAVFSFTWNGIPLIYSGQEMPNHKRLQFFDKDVIEWNGTYALADFYKKLLNLHSSNSAMAAGSTATQTIMLNIPSDGHIMAYIRKSAENLVLVLLNLSPYPSKFSIANDELSGSATELFTSEIKTFSPDAAFELGEWGYKVFVR